MPVASRAESAASGTGPTQARAGEGPRGGPGVLQARRGGPRQGMRRPCLFDPSSWAGRRGLSGGTRDGRWGRCWRCLSWRRRRTSGSTSSSADPHPARPGRRPASSGRHAVVPPAPVCRSRQGAVAGGLAARGLLRAAAGSNRRGAAEGSSVLLLQGGATGRGYVLCLRPGPGPRADWPAGDAQRPASRGGAARDPAARRGGRAACSRRRRCVAPEAAPPPRRRGLPAKGRRALVLCRLTEPGCVLRVCRPVCG